MITLTMTITDVGIANQGLEKLGHAQSMLPPKDEGIASGFNIFKIYIFQIFLVAFDLLNASIAFGRPNVFT